jgi:hypothetical protein
MNRKMLSLKVLAFFVAILLPVAAFGFVSNGNFEAGSYIDDNDVIPVDWVKVETFPDLNNIDEISDIYLVDDNGPGASGENAVHFERSAGGTSGDWTAINQDLDIETNDFSALELWLDIKAMYHNLCGGGQTGAWEYPISAVIHYLDSENNSKDAQIGWYLNSSNDCDATDDWTWWESSNRWAKSRQVDPNIWYIENIDLKDPDLDIDNITGITVGGTGWDFESRVDNISIFVIIPIDIKPGSYPNSINLTSKGVLPVAILTTEDFDALTVDVDSIAFGDLKAGGTASPVKNAEEDVDDDGDIDVILHFSVPELVEINALNKKSIKAFLTAETVNNIPVRGNDSVRIVPTKKTVSPSAGWPGAGGPPYFAGPPWSLTLSGGPPWLQSQSFGPNWYQTGVGGPWWSSRIVPLNTSLSNFSNAGTIGFGRFGNGTLGPRWYQSNIGGPSWFRTGNSSSQSWNGFPGNLPSGPKWYQTQTGGPSWYQSQNCGPKWYQTQTGGPNWYRGGSGRPW